MNDNGFMTPEEMKKKLGLDPYTDNRTLNKYVRQGLLEVKPYSRKTKLYREVTIISLILKLKPVLPTMTG